MECHTPYQRMYSPERDIRLVIDAIVLTVVMEDLILPLQAIAEVKDAKSTYMHSEAQLVTILPII